MLSHNQIDSFPFPLAFFEFEKFLNLFIDLDRTIPCFRDCLFRSSFVKSSSFKSIIVGKILDAERKKQKQKIYSNWNVEKNLFCFILFLFASAFDSDHIL